MSDWHTIGNLAVNGLAAASVALWVTIGVRALQGHPPLEFQPRSAPPWHPLSVALALPASMFVQQTVMSVVPRDRVPILDVSQASCLAMTLAGLIVMGLLALGAPMRAADFGLRSTRIAADLAVGGAGFVASLVPVFAVSLSVQFFKFRPEGPQHQFLKSLDQQPGSATIAWIVVSAGILAPVAEELLYRVIVQGWLESRIGAAPAIVAVALLFSSVHGFDALPLVPLALILGYVYHRRHSYPAVVVLHAAFNLTNLALSLARQPAP